MSDEPGPGDAGGGEIRDRASREHRQESLIARLRREAELRDEELVALRVRLAAAEQELEDLRAIRDALTPPELPQRPGLELAATFVPAADRVSGDFYLVAEGPQNSTVLVVGDVVGHGLPAARRAAFVRTVFAATAPFSDDPCRLLRWANTAMIERAGTSAEFVTAACVTYHPADQRLRWAYAGHPPALSLDDGRELTAPSQGAPLGILAELRAAEGSLRPAAGAGVLLYTDGLTEARRHGKLLGLQAVRVALRGLQMPAPAEVVAHLRARATEFASGALTDDLCLLAARID
jgi:serine phosphatase RsbU (regulator of sigma subunit)